MPPVAFGNCAVQIGEKGMSQADEVPQNDDSDEIIVDGRPPTQNDLETLYLTKYVEAIAAQSELMDKLGYQLITLELAIPGLYAAVLKLTEGDKATVDLNGWFVATFGFWLVALALTVWAVLPRFYRVDTEIIDGGTAESLGIKQFFNESAQFKRRRIIVAIATFWLGIISAVVLLFQ
jgi:hypothetical protein